MMGLNGFEPLTSSLSVTRSNHGVSVYNGRRWQAYDMVQNPKKHVLAGPLGNHIFALKFDTFTNQMWICTEAGISIYQCSARASASPGQPGGIGAIRGGVVFRPGTWHYVTQADGLPQNPDCIAFNPNGTAYVGTQCDGVAIGIPITNSHIAAASASGGPSQHEPAMRMPSSAAYQWRVVTGPWKMPLTATGKGLPSNLINAIVFEPNGTLIAGTDGGIGVAANKNAAFDSSPADWTFMRGRDLTAKVAGLWHPPHHWKAPSRKVLNTLPMEDYTTAIACNDQKQGTPPSLSAAFQSRRTGTNSQLLTTWKLDRKESEIDDHGETYPLDWQGPDLYVYLHIPPGAYTLSLYFFNKDGHSGNNRDRDYVVSMIPVSAGYDFGTASRPNTAPLAAMRGAAQSRVINFWGGVWKRFLVRGPMKLAIRVAKNYSLNTILQAAMLDPLAEHPAPYYYGYRAWNVHEKRRAEFRTQLAAAWRTSPVPWNRHPDDVPADKPSVNSSDQHNCALAADIIPALNLLEHRNSAAWEANQGLAYTEALRWCVAKYGAIPGTRATAAVAERCYYQLGLFHRWEVVEKSGGMSTSRQIEEGLRWNPKTAFLSVNGFQAIRSYVRNLDKEEGKARAKRE